MLAFEFAATFALIVRTKASIARDVLIRGATRDGLFTFRHTTTTDSALSTSTFSIPNTPLWISVIDVAGNFAQGSCYVRVDLSVNGDPLQGLVSGYLSKINSLTWPQADLGQTFPGRGALLTVTGDNPAAGDEWAFTVPADQIWVPKAIHFSLVTDGTAASRIVHVVIAPEGGDMIECISSNAQTATLTWNYSCYSAPSLSASLDGTRATIGIPSDIPLIAGSTIFSRTTAKVAGDNYGAPEIFIERFFSAD